MNSENEIYTEMTMLRTALAEAESAVVRERTEAAAMLIHLSDELTDKIKAIRILERDLETARAEGTRWMKRMRDLENRIRHSMETLRGDMEPPEIDEIRKVRRLESLAPWEIEK